jgi:hypothetical protein
MLDAPKPPSKLPIGARVTIAEEMHRVRCNAPHSSHWELLQFAGMQSIQVLHTVQRSQISSRTVKI